MPRRLLAALLADPGRTRTVDVLIEALWEERTPRDAAKALQLYVSRLRKALPKEARIRTDSSGYALELDEEVLDAARFERLLGEARAASADGNPSLATSLLGRALALWRGPAFGELAYEDFARAEAERLEELRLLAVEERSDAELRLGRHAAVVAELRQLAVEHPSRERMQAQLMLALYRCGRQTDALEVYASLQLRLREELGLELGEELRELQRRILQQDPALALAQADEERETALPVPPNRLLGRERELSELPRLLLAERVRLLVLTGAGGSGKTRLALAAASATASSFANGVCLVELAPLREPELVLGAISRALALQTAPGGDPFEALAAALRPRELLIVLDNAEHVRAAAPLYARLLAQAPRLSLLVTSRVVLHLSGERVYPVEPLAEPAAVTLFTERARAADPRFQPTEEDEQAIRRICRRLDGLPLAVELAAARTSTLTPSELYDRLEPSLPLLTGGPRDLPARQQTLRATLEWSYDLLDDDEQRDLRRLAVFAGGCTLDAAEAVCETRQERLATLVDHNLLRRHTTPEGSRYTMLETIREFASEELQRLNESEALRLRHAQWYCELCERLLGLPGHRRSLGAEVQEAAERVYAEYANVHSAIAWAWSNGQDELALRLGAAYGRLWFERAGFLDARAWLETAAPKFALASPHVQLQALKVAGWITWGILADAAQAERYWLTALETATELNEPADAGWIERWLAGVSWDRGDLDGARVLHERSVENCRVSGNRLGEADSLHLLGEVLRDLERFDEAEQTLRAADALVRELGGRGMYLAPNTLSLAELELDRGNLDAALILYYESLGYLAGVPAVSRFLAATLAGIASVLADRGRDEDAARLWGAVCAAEETLGFRMIGAERRRYEKRLARLEQTGAWTAGRASTLEEAAAALPQAPTVGGK
jgi:predicted ATPase